MNKLFGFLARHHFTLLFLALELLALGLFIRNHAYPQSTFLNTRRATIGAALETRSRWIDYFGLREQNIRLNLENNRLRNALRSNYAELYTRQDTVIDTVLHRQYRYREAEVVKLTHHKANNYITLNRGSIHGLKPGMGIVSDQGIVGVVRSVSPHFASGHTVLHSRFSTSGALKSGLYGNVRWGGGRSRDAEIVDLPDQAGAAPGDTVFTTEFSGIFPEGIPIGIVRTLDRTDDGLFVKARIELLTDFTRLKHVQVIENMLWTERLQLETLVETEP